MADDFAWDVFISYSSADKATVHAVAERLREDGLKVWLDAWEIKPGDHIQSKIDDGLERSRVLVFCMSETAFGSDWTRLEHSTFLFRDRLNKERRFIPLRLDNARIRHSLEPFSYMSWLPVDRERSYPKLLAACRSAPPTKMIEALSGRQYPPERAIRLDYGETIWAYAFDLETTRALTGPDDDRSMRLWDLETVRCLRDLNGPCGRHQCGGLQRGPTPRSFWLLRHDGADVGLGNGSLSASARGSPGFRLEPGLER